jgi:urease accessory protein
MKFKGLLLTILSALFAVSSVSAHQIGGSGIFSGLTHPLFGLDHLLAMIAVGIISTKFDKKMIWVVPSVFVAFMVVGGIVGMLGIGLPFVEIGIALSVLVLGVAIAVSKKLPIGWALVSVGIFAIFHGHAHGAEMPAIISPVLYILGFVVSTVSLHVLGVLAGHYSKKTSFTVKLMRWIGAGMSVVGLLFIIGIF